MNFQGNAKRLKQLIDLAITEDDCHRDITTNNLISPSQKAEATIKLKQDAVVSGVFLAKMILARFDPKIIVKPLCQDGERVKKGSSVLIFRGQATAILKTERVILNFLSHLSGIATKTREAVDLVKGYKVTIFDTRKTIPGLRDLEKFAVHCGGGENHRLNLSEMAMIKDNHYTVLGSRSLQTVVHKIKTQTQKKVEVEVENLRQLTDALNSKADIILLDNFSLPQLKEAVKFVKGKMRNDRPLLEASGGITLKNLKSIAQTGVDRISLGALTHSVSAVDFSLDLKKI